MARSRKKLGEILVGWGMVKPEQVEAASAKARASGKRLGEALVEAGVVKEEQVAKALANQFGMEYVDLSNEGVAKQIDPKLIAEDLIKKHLILPLARSNGKLQIIVHDPMDLELQDMLRFRLNVEIERRLASRSQIKHFIENKLGGEKKQQSSLVGPNDSLVTESIDRSVD